MKYSIVIPVYNRPGEVDELLQSLVGQTHSDFEVVVVEDGSEETCESVVKRYADILALKYFCKKNEGPGMARNYGAAHSQGEYIIVLDSDCVLPEGYIQAIDEELAESPTDAWGGPDRAHGSFTPVQKAISYSMTSFLTTGGIRGNRRQMDRKFYPRSFNMGVLASLYASLGGFSNMRFGEDIDFSIRIYESGATCRLFPKAWVWHKRRTDMRKFFKQVYNSGMARINLAKRHPGTLKAVHLLPAAFTVCGCVLLVFLLLSLAVAAMSDTTAGLCGTALSVAPLLLFSSLVFVDSSIRNREIRVGVLSVLASFVQLIGYGTGFISAWWRRCVCGKTEELQAFKDSFYE